MGAYSDDPAWADITPLPTDEGGPHPLAAIAYSDAYGETMSYLRAVMAANEHSERVLALTADLIDMNPAHYTVWLYRASTLFALEKDLRLELGWLNEVALRYLKNYQIWHHRNLIVGRLADAADAEAAAEMVSAEGAFVEQMLELDAKNYHVWSYRQWLVRRFGLFGSAGELEFVEKLLEQDVRNNSAWNHRWYVINGGGSGPSGPKSGGVKDDAAVREREIDFAKAAIRKAPQNQSPWNYLRGVVKASGMSLASLEAFASEYADLENPDVVRSSHALDLLAEVLAMEEGSKDKAGMALDLLATKYDPIRKNYWEYRKGALGLGAVSV